MSETQKQRVWLERDNGEQLPLEGTCGIGRSADNEVILRDERVSRRHALVHAQGAGEWWLVDLGSSNGTYLNRTRVNRPVRLREADRIEVGPFALVFRQPLEGGGHDIEFTAERTVLDLRTAACWLLVADIEGSTDLAHQLPDEQIAVLTGRWFSACQRVLQRCNGTINKYLGDGFLAYWLETSTSNSEVFRALTELRHLQADRQPQFRIAIHHGQVLMGGKASLGEESLAGRELNFVFRMEKLAGQLRLPLLLSDAARARLGDTLASQDAGSHPLPGFPGIHTFWAV